MSELLRSACLFFFLAFLTRLWLFVVLWRRGQRDAETEGVWPILFLLQTFLGLRHNGKYLILIWLILKHRLKEKKEKRRKRCSLHFIFFPSDFMASACDCYGNLESRIIFVGDDEFNSRIFCLLCHREQQCCSDSWSSQCSLFWSLNIFRHWYEWGFFIRFFCFRFGNGSSFLSLSEYFNPILPPTCTFNDGTSCMMLLHSGWIGLSPHLSSPFFVLGCYE